MANVSIEAIVTGTVWKIEKQVGDTVATGEVVLILESMKMEIPVESPVAGVVRSLAVSEGDSVDEGQTVAVVNQADAVLNSGAAAAVARPART